MSQYYYSVSSLPFLLYNTKVKLTSEEFLNSCVVELSENDYSLLESSSIYSFKESKYRCEVLEKWQNWETSLRNELVKLRSQNLDLDPDKYLQDSSYIHGSFDRAREAFNQESPIEAEEHLNRSRWAYLDELETSHYFDIEKLIIYYLKLQLLERKEKFNKDEGLKNYNDTFKIITEDINSFNNNKERFISGEIK